MQTAPRFAAVLGVKDEADLIEPCIEHLHAIGVTTIHVIDFGSSDGTIEAVQCLVEPGRLTLSLLSDLDPDPRAWSRTASALARKSGADWVLFLDADEFWMPAGGSLDSISGLDSLDLVRVDRFNVPLDLQGLLTGDRQLPSLQQELSLIVRAPPRFRATLEQNPDLPWIRIVPVPKLMVRAERVESVADGFHDIVATEGAPLRRGHRHDLLIAHVPFTSLDRFARKVDNVRRVFGVHDDYCGPNIAWHWRRLLACTDDASIRREFQLQVFDQATLETLRASGTIQTRSEWFASHPVPD